MLIAFLEESGAAASLLVVAPVLGAAGAQAASPKTAVLAPSHLSNERREIFWSVTMVPPNVEMLENARDRRWIGSI
jgi:hypothetical protein